jgi:hypothetical protein
VGCNQACCKSIVIGSSLFCIPSDGLSFFLLSRVYGTALIVGCDGMCLKGGHQSLIFTLSAVCCDRFDDG